MIALYTAFTDDLDDAAYDSVYNNLSLSARSRVDRQKNEQGRKNSLLGHFLVMHGVKTLFGRDTCDVYYNQNGKPCLPFCCFSIAHTENMAVCAFSDTAIGVDVEILRPIKARETYPFFTPRECVFVNNSEVGRDTRFMCIWTRKEAYVKMLGGTMSQQGGTDVSGEVSGAVFSDHGFDRYIITVCEAEGK